jgi:hypothetical protein
LDLRDYGGRGARQRDALAVELATLETLEQVIRWGFAASPPWQLARVCVHDEFTHDVVLARERSPGWSSTPPDSHMRASEHA